MSRERLVEVERLSRFYGAFCAVEDLTFAVRRGEVLGLLGPNGAGKTTTLNILSGTLAPSTGRVIVAGADMRTEARAAKMRLGYLPDVPPLYGELSVEEYLLFCARLRKLEKGKITAAIAHVKATCGLEGVARRLIRNLSKGYQQRLGIAQAIIHTPSVVILDEPTIGLDPLQIQEIRALIKALGEDHCVILSTHILPEVQEVCDRVLIINGGRVAFSGPAAGLAQGGAGGMICATFQRKPAPEALREVLGVSDVDVLDDERIRFKVASDETVDKVIAASVTHGWRLREWVVERASLEQVFTRIVAGSEEKPPLESDTPS